jgi:polyisoprenoid-binding protein YceI
MNFTIDPAHTCATFAVRHMMITNVRGEFQKVSGKVSYDPENLDATRVEITLDATSISTRDAQRDTHLKSADFLDVEKFPAITYVSRSIKEAGAGKLKITGDLTIRGTTREVTLDVDGPTPPNKDPWGNTRIGATATTTIRRSDYGVLWNTALETGGVLVGEAVTITVDVSLIQDK